MLGNVVFSGSHMTKSVKEGLWVAAKLRSLDYAVIVLKLPENRICQGMLILQPI